MKHGNLTEKAADAADRLWFSDLPAHLSNRHPNTPAHTNAFEHARAAAFSDEELAVVQWEESVRWLALGWDGEDEYRHDMHFRFTLDALMHPEGWLAIEPREREALLDRVRVADEVYRRRSATPTQVLDLLLPDQNGANSIQRDELQAMWRVQTERFWFVWVQPLGLGTKALD